MTTTDEHLPPTPGTVTEIPLPDDARALSTFSGLDYVDAFLVASDVRHTPQEWIRAVLQDAPLAVQAQLMSGWAALGLKLGAPGSPGRVLGWVVHRSTPDYILLAADGRLGLNGQLLFRIESRGLLFATFVQHGNPCARRAWAAITPTHRRVVTSLLTHAARRTEVALAHDGVHAQPLSGVVEGGGEL